MVDKRHVAEGGTDLDLDPVPVEAMQPKGGLRGAGTTLASLFRSYHESHACMCAG